MVLVEWDILLGKPVNVVLFIKYILLLEKKNNEYKVVRYIIKLISKKILLFIKPYIHFTEY